MNEYTNTQWRMDLADSDVIGPSPKRLVRVFHDGSWKVLAVVSFPTTYTGSNGGAERESNARLIAAAPRLLKALRACEFALGLTTMKNEYESDAFDAAREAIAVATLPTTKELV